MPTLVVVEQYPLAAQLLMQDAVLLAAVVSGLMPLLSEPIGDDCGKDLEERVH